MTARSFQNCPCGQVTLSLSESPFHHEQSGYHRTDVTGLLEGLNEIMQSSADTMHDEWQVTVQCEPPLLALLTTTSPVKWDSEFLPLPHFT